MRNGTFIGVVAIALALAACDDGKKDKEKDKGKGDTSAAAKSTGAPAASGSGGPAASSSAAAPSGLMAGADKAVVDEAKKVLTCPWEDGRPKWDCEANKTWDKLPALEDGKADKTLVALLTDPEQKLRVIAAEALSSHGQTYREDKALVEPMLKMVEDGPDEDLTVTLARVVSRAKTDKLGLSDRIIAIMKSHKSKRVRTEVIRGAQFTDSEKYFDTTMALAKDADETIKYEAMGAFWVGTPSGKEKEVCQLWADLTKDPVERVASEAGYLAMFSSKGCTDQFDGILKDAAEKLKGDVKNSSYTRWLEYFMLNSKASDKQKADAVKILKGVADNAKNNWIARNSALRGVTKGDPKGAKAYLGKFKTDKEDFVKKEAERLLEQLEKDEKKEKDKPKGK